MIPSDFATDFATGAANVAVLVFWFCAAFPICITIHELGHALAAEVVGLRVIGFGIGEHSPFFSIPVFGARFFLARPFGGGFTLVVDEAIRSPPWKMVVTTAAGPIASLLLCWFATTGLIQIGYHPLFLGVAVMSARDFFASVIPRRFRASGRWGLNDAALILHTLREEEFRVMLPGDFLRWVQSQRDFCRQLQHVGGEAYYTVLVAFALHELQDGEGARLALSEPILQARKRGSMGRKVEALARATLVADRSEDEVASAIRAAEVALRDDPFGLATLAINEAARRIEDDGAVLDMLRVAEERALVTESPQLRNTVAALRLTLARPVDFAAESRSLLAIRGRGQLSPTMALSLAVHGMVILIERDELPAAGELLSASRRGLQEILASVGDPDLRDRFEARYRPSLTAAGKILEVDNDERSDKLAETIGNRVPKKSSDGLTPLGKVVLAIGILILAILIGAVLMAE